MSHGPSVENAPSVGWPTPLCSAMATFELPILPALERYTLLTGLIVPRPIGWIGTFAQDGGCNPIDAATARDDKLEFVIPQRQDWTRSIKLEPVVRRLSSTPTSLRSSRASTEPKRTFRHISSGPCAAGRSVTSSR